MYYSVFTWTSVTGLLLVFCCNLVSFNIMWTRNLVSVIRVRHYRKPDFPQVDFSWRTLISLPCIQVSNQGFTCEHVQDKILWMRKVSLWQQNGYIRKLHVEIKVRQKLKLTCCIFYSKQVTTVHVNMLCDLLWSWAPKIPVSGFNLNKQSSRQQSQLKTEIRNFVFLSLRDKNSIRQQHVSDIWCYWLIWKFQIFNRR